MEAKQIKCPQCGRFTFYSLENPARPFCSERCRLIDLGQWADESYKIPTKINTDLNPEDFAAEIELDAHNDDEGEA